MNIEKFNVCQIKKVDDTITKMINQYQELQKFINDYKEGFTEMQSLIKKLDPNKIVSQKVRQAYYILLKDFVTKYDNILDSWLYMQHISIYLKSNIGEYIEENILTLPPFDIYRDNPDYIIEVDENNFVMPVKIKTYIDDIDNLPINYYKLYNNKYMSTNRLALNIIEKVLLSMDDISTCLDVLIDSAFKKIKNTSS